MVLAEDRVLNLLARMDDYRFEHFIAEIWEARGWDTTVTTGSNDRGVDVIAKKSTPFTQKQLIQAKRYGRDQTIGSPAVQQYSSLKQQEDSVDAVVIVTTGSFTSPARQTAKDLNVKLIDGHELFELLNTGDEHKVLREYFDFSQEVGDQDEEYHLTRSQDDEPITSRETSISRAIGQKHYGTSDNPSEGNDTTPSSETIYDSLISETPFEDSDDLIEMPTKSDFFGDFCPVCNGFDSIWSAEYETSLKPVYKCGECETTWRWEKALLRKSKWKAYGGPQDGIKKTKRQWWKQ